MKILNNYGSMTSVYNPLGDYTNIMISYTIKGNKVNKIYSIEDLIKELKRSIK